MGGRLLGVGNGSERRTGSGLPGARWQWTGGGEAGCARSRLLVDGRAGWGEVGSRSMPAGQRGGERKTAVEVVGPAWRGLCHSRDVASQIAADTSLRTFLELTLPALWSGEEYTCMYVYTYVDMGHEVS